MTPNKFTKSLKFIFKAVGGLAIGAVVTHQACEQALQHLADTPEEFVLAERGHPYSPKATSFLREHQDIRVIKSGSPLLTFYKISHPLLYAVHKIGSGAFPNNTYFHPNDLAGFFPSKAVIVMDGMDAPPLYSSKGDRASKPDIEFAFTLFHEINHHKDVKKEGSAAALNKPIVLREGTADLGAVDNLSDDFDGKVASYARAFRAITSPMDDLHDTLPSLLTGDALSNVQGPAIKSYSDFLGDSERCLRSYDKTRKLDEIRHEASKAPLPLPLRKTGVLILYECFKASEADLEAKALPDPINTPARKLEYVRGFEFLQKHGLL
ncbi:MAG: hypothetical protein WC043_01240 [Pseudobdellovibrionaceae bacterium]